MKKNTKQLIISLIAGVLLFVGTYKFISGLIEENKSLKNGKIQENLDYVVLKEDKKSGYVIKNEDIELKYMQIGIEGGYKNLKDVEGKTLAKDIKAGIPLTKNIFGEKNQLSSQVASGYRAITLKVAQNSIPQNFSAPCKVDLYSSKDGLLVKNVKVLSYSSKDGTILIEVPKEDVTDFLNIVAKSQVSLILKNESDYDEEYGFSYEGGGDYIEDYNIEAMPKITGYTIDEIKSEQGKENTIKKTEVELIKGNSKTKVEF